jgi:site-specific recombinase XerD
VFTKSIRHFGDVAPETLTADDFEQWRDSMLLGEQLMPTTINNYLRWIGTFYNWLVDEGVIDSSPVVQVPYVRTKDRAPEPPVFTPAEVRSLIAASAVPRQGRGTFEALRNETLLSLLADTGIRASECKGALLDNLNLPARQLLIHAEISKGRYDRIVVFGFQVARLLGRYLRERDAHVHAHAPTLFVGRRGPLSYCAVRDIVNVAAQDAGVEGAHAHLFRHTWAHDLKATGADVEVLMSLGGWTSPQMVARYGRAEKTVRAVAAYQRVGSPLDRAMTKGAAQK